MNKEVDKFLYRILDFPDKKILKIYSDNYKLLKKLFFELERDLEKELHGELKIEDFSSALTIEIDLVFMDIEKRILNFIENKKSWEGNKY